jgi:hypothetical protein
VFAAAAQEASMKRKGPTHRVCPGDSGDPVWLNCDVPEEFLQEVTLQARLASAEIELPQDRADRLEDALAELERVAEMEQMRLSWG